MQEKMINKIYKNLVTKIYNEGFEYEDPNRKGVIRKQIPYYNFEYSFENGFPIIGLKQTFSKMAFNEMKVFMQGKTNLKDLEDLGVCFWQKDAYNYYLKVSNFAGNKFSLMTFEAFVNTVNLCDISDLKNWWLNEGYDINYTLGDLGKIYPHQIRNWNGGIDQLDNVLDRLKVNPMSTKNIVTMWNPSDEKEQSLTPCHTRFSFIVRPLAVFERCQMIRYTEHYDWYFENVKGSEKKDYCDKIGIPKYGLTIQWNQDSVDTFLGLPINIQYYSYVCYVFAHYLNMKPLGIIPNLTNVHLYNNSFSAVKEMLERDENSLNKVEVKLNLPKDWTSLDNYLAQLEYGKSIQLLNYNHLGRLDVEMLAYSK